ncbi:MAG: transcriptional repressor [Lachnospiraceae bacterium]|nr:transcriptional repressor [Lachnospiraceae bacterium]
MARSDGYRTKGRQLILSYLEATKERTVSVSEIQEFMEQQGNPVNVSTIYRNLDALVAQGKVMKFVADKGDKSTYRYIEPEHDCHKHLHIQCVKCGKVIHLECDFMRSIEKHVLEEHGISLLCENSILYGVCQGCKST